MNATFIRQLTGWNGDAALYKLDPPYVAKSYGEDCKEQTKEIEFVIASAVNNAFAHETMIFEAKENGDCVSFLDLACIRDSLSHSDCLAKLGYKAVWP